MEIMQPPGGGGMDRSNISVSPYFLEFERAVRESLTRLEEKMGSVLEHIATSTAIVKDHETRLARVENRCVALNHAGIMHENAVALVELRRAMDSMRSDFAVATQKTDDKLNAVDGDLQRIHSEMAELNSDVVSLKTSRAGMTWSGRTILMTVSLIGWVVTLVTTMWLHFHG